MSTFALRHVAASFSALLLLAGACGDETGAGGTTSSGGGGNSSNGAPCSAAADCDSGHCADGVCCRTPCAGACDACNVQGKEGECTPSAAGAPGEPTCSPYLCDGASGACPATCDSPDDCAANVCVAGACPSPGANGDPCTAPTDCDSSFCADGVCCESECAGGCEACDNAGSAGTCQPDLAGAPGDPSCSPYVCDGVTGVCPMSCTTNADCAAGFSCSNSVCTA